MLSDEVKVKTRHINDPVKYDVTLSKNDEYVSIHHNEEVINEGTEVILQYSEFIKGWGKLDDLYSFIASHFLTDNVNITVIDRDKQTKNKISNPIIEESMDDNNRTVKLENILEGIEGQVKVQKHIDRIFTRDLLDINFDGVVYIYEDGDLIEVDEGNQHLLLEYLKDYSMQTVTLPIVHERSGLEEILHVIDDLDTAFERYEDMYDPDSITIVFKENLLKDLNTGYLEYESEILPELYVANLKSLGHDHFASTYVERDEKIIYHLSDRSLFLGINKSFPFKLTKDVLFIRGVFVTSFTFDVPFSINKLTVDNLKINITNKDIVANVNRNDVNKKTLNDIQIAVYQAILFSIYEGLDDQVQKTTLLNFIQRYYNIDNQFLKSSYKKLLSK